MKDHPPRAMSESTLALSAWKKAASRLRAAAGVADDLDRRAQDRFRKTVVRTYWGPIHKEAMQKCNWSQAKLATMLGTSRATINRWDGDLVGRADKQSIEPSLSLFLQVLCAFQIDRQSLPDGLAVTLEAYRQVHAEIALALHGERPDPLICDAEILCMHYLCRSVRWRDAQLAGDTAVLTKVSEEICHKIARLIPASSLQNVDQVREAASRHANAWSILETVILHEWF